MPAWWRQSVFTGDGPVPRARHHHHDAQVAARPRGGLVLATEEYAGRRQGLPMVLGGPLSHP